MNDRTMKQSTALTALCLAIAAAVFAPGAAYALDPTDLSGFNTRAFESKDSGGKTIRFYKDLAYSTRDDLATEGSGYTGGGSGTHRSGTYYDVFVESDAFASSETRSEMPVFLFLHGGAWCEPYDKDVSCHDLMKAVAAKGYFVVSMDCQLQENSIDGGATSPRANATFGHMLKDVDTMLDYLKAELPKIGVPTNKVVIGGESAGGHLALCYAFDQASPLPAMSEVGLSALTHPLPVACVTSVVGPADLSEGQLAQMMYSPGFDLIVQYLDENQRAQAVGMKNLMDWLTGTNMSSMGYDEAKAVIQKWAPLLQVNSNVCPAILAYGCTNVVADASSTDGLVPVSNFVGLTNNLEQAGVSYDAKLFTGMNHGEVAGNGAGWIADKLAAFKAANFDPEPVVYGPLATNLYAKSMNVIFAGVQDGAELTNFPVLVRLSTAIEGFSYSDFSKTDGEDLRFADESGTLLPHEIDTWNTAGESTVWVKVPLLRKKSYITAHYGFTGTGDPAPVDPKDVWDDDYVGVWHLGESALPLKESSETSSDFRTSTGSGIGYASAGIVGKSVDFGESGNSRSVIAPDHDALDGFTACTFEAWTYMDADARSFKKDGTDAAKGLLTKRTGYGNQASYHLWDAGSGTSICISSNSTTHTAIAGIANVPSGEWVHQVVTFNAGSTANYKGGAAAGTGTTPVKKINAGDADLHLGNFQAGDTRNFPGKIDEVRISKVARSAAWVKATHDTIANAGFSVCLFGELDFGESVSNLLLKASTDKENPIDYVEGEQIRFDFRLDGVVALPLELRAKEPLYVIWTRTADDGVTVKGTNTISLAQGFSVTTSLAIPGIVKMTGTLVGSDYKAISFINPADGKSKNITFGGGAGVATEKMQLSTVEPADFDQFWAEAKAKLATVPFDDSNVELIDVTPSNISNDYYIYAAKIPCFGPRPVTGWLTVPRNPKAGGVPIQANFDGYGCISAAPKVPTYGAGQCVRFAVNAHGYDMVGHDDKYYKDFNDYINKTNRTFNGTTYGYACAPQDYDNPTNTYFYYMAMRIMRAYDYLKTRPEWNGRDVIAAGGSQGGLQTMWAGGLVDGITKISPSITWGCDIGCPFNGKGTYPSRTWGIPSVPGAYYFDSALHAKRVPRDCIANITRLGMGDYTCPPRGVLLSYYNMKCAVSAYLVQGSDHGYTPPQPNQVFTISKEAVPEPVAAFASDSAGFDYTNRVVTVTNATAGATLTLTATASDGTTTTATATVDANGEATFDIATAPGAGYSYSVTEDDYEIASGGFFTGGWNAGGTWFSASAESGASVVSGGDWNATPGITEGKYTIDGTSDFALGADAVAAGAGRLVRVDFNVSFGELGYADTLVGKEESEYSCFTAVTNDLTGKALWMASGKGGWIPLYGGVVPQANKMYCVRAEADFAGNPPQVRYEVSSDNGATFEPLYTNAARTARWIECSSGDSLSGDSLSGVEFDGRGAVASLGGTFAAANIAEADGVGYESLADAVAAATNSLVLLTNATWPTNTPVGTTAVNLGGYALNGVTLDGDGKAIVQSGYSQIPGEGKVNITLEQAAALGVETAGKSPAQIAAELAKDGANGIPLWESYVLGLDPNNATAKPKATIVMNGDTVELRLVGINVQDGTGATVTYKVYKFDDLSNVDEQPVGGDRAVTTKAEVPKSSSEPKMFYRLKVDVKGY